MQFNPTAFFEQRKPGCAASFLLVFWVPLVPATAQARQGPAAWHAAPQVSVCVPLYQQSK